MTIIDVFCSKKRIKEQISRINEKLALRESIKNGKFKVEGIRIKGINADRDLVYQINGNVCGCIFSVNIERYWTNIIEEDVEQFESCHTLKELSAMSQKIAVA